MVHGIGALQSSPAIACIYIQKVQLEELRRFKSVAV